MPADWFKYVPFAHKLHASEPFIGLYFPNEQGVHGPPSGPVYPGEHFAHGPPSGPSYPRLQVQLCMLGLALGEKLFVGHRVHSELALSL